MGTLYRRFPTKDALLTALSDEIMDSILRRSRELATAHAASGDGLEQALAYMGAEMASHHGCLTRLWQAVPPTPDERRSELGACWTPSSPRAAAPAASGPTSP